MIIKLASQTDNVNKKYNQKHKLMASLGTVSAGATLGMLGSEIADSIKYGGHPRVSRSLAGIAVMSPFLAHRFYKTYQMEKGKKK